MEPQNSSEVHCILAKLTDYDNLLNVHLLESVIDTHKRNVKDNSKVLQDIANNTEILEKKILNVENEVSKIKLSHNKNNEKYKIVNGERLKLAKRFVDLENEFSKMKSESDDLDVLIKKYTDEIRSISKPSFNQLYLELIKGFGLEFINDGKHICRVRNTRKKCYIDTELDRNEPLYKICNEIWDSMQ
ncbi:hypothetical protein NCER_100742 [Vairimorpha ceranae BRL01]|uniref:Kinetochore protein Spc24 n=1 Tax=Vairimorpha ceranae (strain BRL01) TaxID=578460 RepID=C4V8C8_VAIC1|nr:hypothetical protein NCER_100742 [Vairimorpha ceranae BRL01]